MVIGSFLDRRDLPVVRLFLTFNSSASYPEFIIDTGFSGDLKIDMLTADDLGIDKNKLIHRYIDNANGERILVGSTHGFVELEDKKRGVEIIVADGPHLLGIKFLSAFGYKAVVDCKNWECYLEAA